MLPPLYAAALDTRATVFTESKKVGHLVIGVNMLLFNIILLRKYSLILSSIDSDTMFHNNITIITCASALMVPAMPELPFSLL